MTFLNHILSIELNLKSLNREGRMKKLLFFFISLIFISNVYSQINAKLMRYIDVSDTQITFVYGGDIWIMPKTGGTAIQVTHSPGEESWPRFSPDGKLIAYSASYNGRYSQLYTINKNGGSATKLKMPYGELASYAPDGNSLAYITKLTESFPFKRYRGGYSSDIIIYNFGNDTAERITESWAIDGKPAWVGDKIYFLSDQGENMRLNIWVYDTVGKQSSQITTVKDFDITFMSAGNKDLVFEAGGVLNLMDLNTQQYKPVNVNVVSDLSVEMPRAKDVSKNISNMTASPEGKRIVFEARGDLFNVPVLDGYVLNMTKSSGAFDRNPAWSPDGKNIAYWSDRSGENEIWLQPTDGNEKAKKITNRKVGFGYNLFWSPNSKKLAFIDEKNEINVLDVASEKVIVAGQTLWHQSHGGRPNFRISWSPDSRYITFTKGVENSNNAVFIFDIDTEKSYQVTSGFYHDNSPVFSTDGKYLFYLTNRHFSANYSDMDATWIYPNATQIASISLTKDTSSLLQPKSDELKKDDDKEKDKDEDKDKNDDKKKEEVEVKIDFDNLEARLTLLPPKAGNMSGIIPFEGKLVYHRYPNTGSGEEEASLIVYDFEEREEKTVMAGVNTAVLTGDGKSLLVASKDKHGIIKPEADQKIEDPIPTDGLVMDLVPKVEWRQIFQDTWRRYRDFFYDPNMHQVDWPVMRERYGKLVEDARTRWDVRNIQANLGAELSAGHTYAFGGDAENVPQRAAGYLGIDWELNNNLHRIKRIVKPAAWDTEVRSPLDQPGVDVKVGDYILAVNGVQLDPKKEPYAAFEGLDGKTVALTVSSSGKMSNSKKVVIKCLSQNEENRLRYLEWIENNRKMVDKLSGGQLGYIYMSNTSSRGQLELVRMFYGQLDKKGFIIDERFNGGGQLPDRFLELIQRPVVSHMHWRYGKDHHWPVKTNTGPVGMIINGWAGSGGDALPWAFQELKAGPIVGERTLGILVGPATGHRLIDGGGITVPGGRLYDNDGHWFWEGEGVSPDIEVWDDPNLLVKGRDPQIEKTVEEVLKLVKTISSEITPAPPLEDRTAKGLNTKN
jgi:tricorn protease